MTRTEPRLTPTQALAAATAYGWSVLPHDHGGFFAQVGQHQMVVAFNEDGSFRHAQVRERDGEVPLFLEEGTVVFAFTQYGRPAISEPPAWPGPFTDEECEAAARLVLERGYVQTTVVNADPSAGPVRPDEEAAT
ncbi:hypothetical protein ACKI14_02610 [Streptomyces turgidiscabies]|uniref:hypothetical protein n=1 Tax=Streptomyces turgidiscabies TaxID=85558 RepID=UPI0038F7EC94